jgi:hypothetical protein
VRKEFQHAVVDLKTRELLCIEFRFGLENADAEFVIGRVQVNDEAALETRFDTVFEVFDFTRCAVGGNDDLFAGFNESVEGVEELFLGRVFARDELNVVDHQDVD